MSYQCGVHGWRHLLDPCPSCQTVEWTDRTRSDYQNIQAMQVMRDQSGVAKLLEKIASLESRLVVLDKAVDDWKKSYEEQSERLAQLEKRSAWQGEMLERAKGQMGRIREYWHDVHTESAVLDQWLSDLAAGQEKERGDGSGR